MCQLIKLKLLISSFRNIGYQLCKFENNNTLIKIHNRLSYRTSTTFNGLNSKFKLISAHIKQSFDHIRKPSMKLKVITWSELCDEIKRDHVV